MPSHFAERHGLIVIIALGESIVAIGVGAEAGVNAGVVAAAVLGIAVAAALWWLYFDVVALVAERRLSNAAEGEERNRIARDSYSYLHFPMVAGIVLVALGLKKTLGDVADPLKLVPAVALLGGTALYLLAHVAFRWRNVHRLSLQRLVCAAAAGRLVPLAVELPALATARRAGGGADGADRLRDGCASRSCATACATSSRARRPWTDAARRGHSDRRARAGEVGGMVRLTACAAALAALVLAVFTPAASGLGAGGVMGVDNSNLPALSGDGRFVAFLSFSGNMTPDDPDVLMDVFVRDLETGAVTLVSRADGVNRAKAEFRSQVGQGRNYNRPAISGDGRYVAFESDAANLSPDDTDNARDIYLRDLVARTTTLVSRDVPIVSISHEWFTPAMSSDGRYVAFRYRYNKPGNTGTGHQVILVRDLQAATTAPLLCSPPVRPSPAPG